MSACQSRIRRATVRRFSSVGMSSPSWMSSTSTADAELLRALLDLGLAALGERPACLLEMSDVAVGHGDELHLAPRCDHSDATPAAFSSASSGCAPKAMTRSGAACVACAAIRVPVGIANARSSVNVTQSGFMGKTSLVNLVNAGRLAEVGYDRFDGAIGYQERPDARHLLNLSRLKNVMRDRWPRTVVPVVPSHLITYPRMIVLGIDAGGTKTVCQLADGDGSGAGRIARAGGEPRVAW